MIRCPLCKCLYAVPEREREREEISCPFCKFVIPFEKGISRFSEDESDEYFFPVEAFSILYEKEDAHFWFRSRTRIIESFIKRHISLDPASDTKFCEVGCGTGLLSKHLVKKGYRVSCCDLFFEGLLFARERGSGDEYFQCNLLEFPFFNEFDVILACDVLEHIAEDTNALSQLFEALKPGGYCIITVPAGKSLWSETDVHAGHKRRYDRDEIIRKVKYSGFLPVRTSYFMTIPFPILWVKRVLSNSLKGPLAESGDGMKVSNELDLPWILNELLYLSLLPERMIIPHVNLPFGSSLICIAQKKGK